VVPKRYFNEIFAAGPKHKGGVRLLISPEPVSVMKKKRSTSFRVVF
jgi:hypothetical protein